MSIALIFNNKDPKPWATGLQAKLVDTPVEIYPHISNYSKVTYALCWKPAPQVLAKFAHLVVVQSVGASVEHITRTQHLPPGVQLARIVDENLSHDMWEFLLAGVLAHLKNFTIYRQQQQNQSWQQQPYKTIGTSTVAVLGLGKIGAYVAQKFGVLGFRVVGWSGSEKKLPKVQSYTGNEGLTTCLNNADILINLLPLTNATENILCRENLLKSKPGTFLINAGRGEHLVDDDLLELLNQGHLSGALLDVFRQEPLPKDHSFWAHPKIQITPHVASLTNKDSALRQIVDNYKNHLAGKPLQNVVSLKKGY